MTSREGQEHVVGKAKPRDLRILLTNTLSYLDDVRVAPSQSLIFVKIGWDHFADGATKK